MLCAADDAIPEVTTIKVDATKKVSNRRPKINHCIMLNNCPAFVAKFCRYNDSFPETRYVIGER